MSGIVTLGKLVVEFSEKSSLQVGENKTSCIQWFVGC